MRRIHDREYTNLETIQLILNKKEANSNNPIKINFLESFKHKPTISSTCDLDYGVMSFTKVDKKSFVLEFDEIKTKKEITIFIVAFDDNE